MLEGHIYILHCKHPHEVLVSSLGNNAYGLYLTLSRYPHEY